MIDKNDVKMPVQREDGDTQLLNEEEKKEHAQKVEDLLELVNSVESKQELRLNEKYYNKFHWFGSAHASIQEEKSYFSYQEEAVYDFIFNLNKSGILSDQVGMGKTIEAGMIISELASRNELRSLLIVVPNEIMAEKWNWELAEKFGIRSFMFNHTIPFPQAKVLLNYEDFCKCVYDCVSREKFSALGRYQFTHEYKEEGEQSLDKVIRRYVMDDLKTAIDIINEGFENSDMPLTVSFDGKSFRIKDDKQSREQAYIYDGKGEIAKFVSEQSKQKLSTVLSGAYFRNRYATIIRNELYSLSVLIGDFFTSLPEEISGVADAMANSYPILIVPNTYTVYKGGKPTQKEFLNQILSAEIHNYKHKYMVKEDGKIGEKFEEYRIIDFLIDVGYQTLIVDEVHDYIDVSAAVSRNAFHANPEQYEKQFSSSEYNRYELFDDYYFIKKKSLYKKLKELADKANRKIFLTATPIKSDMVDFYLLSLIASNKDADVYKRIRDNLDSTFPRSKDRENAIERLYDAFRFCLEEYAARNFCDDVGRYLQVDAQIMRDKLVIRRYKYPYFNNAFLLANTNDPEAVKHYLMSQLNYMSMEEIILELINAYELETKGKNKEAGIKQTMDALNNLLVSDDGDRALQTRVVYRALLDNNVKQRFEEDFMDATVVDGRIIYKPIKRIRQLLELNDGPRRWHKTYRKYGIRHTRHQTFNLSECANLDKLGKSKIERYKNLPYWPKRDGKVIFLLRDDSFFDSYLNVERELPDVEEKEIALTDLPNYEKMAGTPEEIGERFTKAKEIFDYINESMSGGGVDHLPQSSRYESVDIDDSVMVDYKLALVNKLMLGRDSLGSIKGKVLLFAQDKREKIMEWFQYQQCDPIYKKMGGALDPEKLDAYREKWHRYSVEPLGDKWKVSDNTEDLHRYTEENLLIVIDPSRYEKGVDLQKAGTIINFDINYDPLKMEQRIGRIDRIRPLGQSREINIISFVPLNDMSGFVINFFANEMKMFTQWMGETTGIVSVPDEEGDKGARDVSFESKVNKLEEFYKYLYVLCSGQKLPRSIHEMAQKYAEHFHSALEESGILPYQVEADFEFLQALHGSFDRAFRNSITPLRAGYPLRDNKDVRLMRFNTSYGVFDPCEKASCEHCSERSRCNSENERRKKRNVYSEFRAGVVDFFNDGEAFYNKKDEEYKQQREELIVHGVDASAAEDLTRHLQARAARFKSLRDTVLALMPPETTESFTMPYNDFLAIFGPMKELFWDEVVQFYLDFILADFHRQCDSVLEGAKLFERFIKTFSIAEFMNNMEGANG